MYIVFEGVDTSGKSTQIEILSKIHDDFIITKEPGGTTFGAHIRELLLETQSAKEELSSRSELLLFLADRAEHFDKVIKPNMDRTIISDRSFISGLAYALSNNNDFDENFLYAMNEFALNGTLPQKIVFFKTNKELLNKRLGKKTNDVIEKRGINYLLEVQAKMEAIIQSLHVETLHVNASDDIKEIAKQIERFIG